MVRLVNSMAEHSLHKAYVAERDKLIAEIGNNIVQGRKILSQKVDDFMVKLLEFAKIDNRFPSQEIQKNIIKIFKELGLYSKIQFAKDYGYRLYESMKEDCNDEIRRKGHEFGDELGTILICEEICDPEKAVDENRYLMCTGWEISEWWVLKEKDPERRKMLMREYYLDRVRIEWLGIGIHEFEEAAGLGDMTEAWRNDYELEEKWSRERLPKKEKEWLDSREEWIPYEERDCSYCEE